MIFFKRKLFWFLVVVVLAIGGWYGYRALTDRPAAQQYVTVAVQRGMIAVSVSGTGQVSSSSQVDLKPTASGKVVYVGAKAGQTVTANQLLLSVDSRSAQRTVSDAETALETARLSLAKLKEPADSLTLMQYENSLLTARNAKQNAEDDLIKAYEDGFNTITNAFLDLPDIMTGLHDVLMGNDANANQWNLDFYADAAKTYDLKATGYRDTAYASYQKARTAYDSNFIAYKNTTRYSDSETIVALVNQTYETTKLLSDAVKDASNLIQFYNDKLTERSLQPIPVATVHLNALNGYTGTSNSNLSSLLNIKQNIQTDLETIDSSTRTIAEKEISLEKLKAGTDALDLRAAEISIAQKQNALLDARQKLADYYLRAPFAGTIAAVSVRVGDTVSGTAFTIISPQQVAEVSLNEVDVAQVKVGQKATMTFDAIADLTVSGTVSEIDTIGTASQGVVSYTVKVAFDTQDDRIKSGMSVSSAIITGSKTDVLFVPNSAVKQSADGAYVQVLKNGVPERVSVTTGISNDTSTEITSGINEGDEVVTQTVTSANTNSSKNNAGGFQGIGGEMRIMR